jgi:hypothetical protein
LEIRRIPKITKIHAFHHGLDSVIPEKLFETNMFPSHQEGVNLWSELIGGTVLLEVNTSRYVTIRVKPSSPCGTIVKVVCRCIQKRANLQLLS